MRPTGILAHPFLTDCQRPALFTARPMRAMIFKSQAPLVQIRKPGRRQLRVSNRVLNVLMSQVILNEPGVSSAVRQIVPASVAQHVRVNVQLRESRILGKGVDHLEEKTRNGI
jgi:hypothetical protein